jgi:NAD(P)-dependent dehydrogenase (short-subunit alcohol dehydrogenase family)
VRLKDKVAVVTGAGSGIGSATTALFAEEGATVIGADLTGSDAGAVRRLDVGNLAGWEALVADVVAEYGTIDVLVNNAGIVKAYEGVADVTLEDWRAVLRVNLDGVFFGMRTVIPVMREHGGGSVVNVSSIWGIAGAPGVAAYQASKGAVRTLSKSAALTHAGDGIRVNSLHPGLVMTPLIAAQDDALTQGIVDATPLGRGADPRELAYAALFLSCGESSFVTGTELVVDGGYLTP